MHFDELDFPVDSLKAASKVVSGRLNDAFVAGVAGGLRRYHEKHGSEVDALRMTMPINVRSTSNGERGRQPVRTGPLPGPVGIVDPIERMNAIRALVEHERAEPALLLTDAIASILNRLPTTATTSLFGGMLKCVDFVTSNVPGPPIPVFMAGARDHRPVRLRAPDRLRRQRRAAVPLRPRATSASTRIRPPSPIRTRFVACLRDSFEEICALGVSAWPLASGRQRRSTATAKPSRTYNGNSVERHLDRLLVGPSTTWSRFQKLTQRPGGNQTDRSRAPDFHTGATSRSSPSIHSSQRFAAPGSSGHRNTSGRTKVSPSSVRLVGQLDQVRLQRVVEQHVPLVDREQLVALSAPGGRSHGAAPWPWKRISGLAAPTSIQRAYTSGSVHSE